MLCSRPFGQTGISAPALGLGAGPLGDHAINDAQALHLLHRAADLGVRLVDTAPSYGRSEERIGRFLRERPGLVVSTKLGYGVPGIEDWTGPTITRGVDLALGRLGVEVIDIAHLHSCPTWILERGDVVEALNRAVEAGKIRVAAYSGEGEALEWAVRSGAFGSIQASVSVCDPVGGRTLLPEAVSRGMGVLAKRPLANAPWRAGASPGSPEAIYAERWAALRLEVDLPPGELLLRWAVFHPAVHVTIAGTTRAANLEANVAAVEKGPLPADVLAAVDAAITRVSDGWPGVI